jgi:predicted glutamine amidotransferase
MNQTETQRQAYKEYVGKNKDITDRQKILSIFIDNPNARYSQKKISELTGLVRRTVSGRMNELVYKTHDLVIDRKIGAFNYYRLRNDGELPQFRSYTDKEKLKLIVDYAKENKQSVNDVISIDYDNFMSFVRRVI